MNSTPRENGEHVGVGRVAKLRQTTSCLKNCLILSSYSFVSSLRALSQPTPRGYGLIFHVHTRGKQDEDRKDGGFPYLG